MQVWLYTIVSVLVVSLISLIGIITITIKNNILNKILLYSVSFAAGSLLGDVFFHLLPADKNLTIYNSIFVLIGIMIFFILEKIIRWRHCHMLTTKEHQHPLSLIILVGDSLHNFIDGLTIAASYLIDIKVGIATTLAIIFHEIPQEIGDFSALIYGGFSKAKALIFNFLSALTAVLGAVIILIINNINLVAYLIPLTAGGFIYIASSDLIPELHKEVEIKKSLLQLLFFTIGILFMLGLTFIE
ncbi:MAG: ZIP family metal transporter [Candidatus Nanoarchaeia archaeon]|nr:ZIP family metal transporter [Candidatus Nanoarchaeia archaeon]